MRTDSAKRLIDEISISVVRGNASEVLSLTLEGSLTKGVDSIHSVDDAANAALILAKELNTTLAITGAVDLITDGRGSPHHSSSSSLIFSFFNRL